MISLRLKLVANSLSVLGLAAISCSAVSYIGLTKISDKFLTRSKERSEVVIGSYVKMSSDNISKIQHIYETGLMNKGKSLLSKDMASLTPMIADNSFLGVQQFLQKTFEDDQEIISATYFVVQKKEVKAWHFVSRDHPKGLGFPVVYDLKRKGWESKSKTGKAVFVSDPHISEVLQLNQPQTKNDAKGPEKHEFSTLYFTIPFVEGKTGKAVHEARKKGESIGFLRYVLSAEEMHRTVAEEKSKLESTLSSLKEGNATALKESEKIAKLTKEEVLFSLFLGALVVTGFGYLISLVMSGKMTGPLKRLTGVATEMADGIYEHNVPVESNDEIGVLALTFQKMAEAIRRRDEELAEINKNLEKLVELRTTQLKVENRKIAALLNNMKQAVFSVAQDGKVVSPVSLYSEQVFGGAIEGKSILDFIFHQLDRKGEEYSKLTTNLVISFGEDELQWLVIEGDLPKKVILAKSPKSEQDTGLQTLKINYSPLYDESGLLEKILFVVEDITELERLELQNVTQKAQLDMLRQLTESGAEAVKNFFGGTANLIGAIEQILRSGSASITDFPLILRNLHTVKGNARNLSLTEISSIVHDVENDVLQIKSQHPSVNSPSGKSEQHQVLSPSDVEVCQNGLTRIRAVLGEYMRVAMEVYGIRDDFQIRAQAEFHRLLIEIGWDLAEKKDPQWILKKLEGLEGIASELTETGIIEICSVIKREFVQGKLDLKSRFWKLLVLKSIAVTYQTGIFTQHSTQVNIWVGLCDAIWTISETLRQINEEALRGESREEYRIRFLTEMERGTSFCGVNNLSFYSGYLEAMDFAIRKYYEQKDQSFLKRALDLESEIWLQLLLTAQFHAGLKLSDESREAAIHGLGALVANERVPDEVSKLDCWLISLGRHFWSKEKLFATFRERWAERVGIRPENFFAVALRPAEWMDQRFDLKDRLTDPSHDLHLEKEADAIDIILKGTLVQKSSLNSYLKMLDILELVAGSIDTPELLKSRYRTLEVVEMNINNLKSSILDRLSGLAQISDVTAIIREVDRLMESPLKPMLWSYKKMVEDLSGKMGKKVKFSVQGDDVMLPKETLELIQDGIVHILRNALDHGIEREEERAKLGKPIPANLTAECFYRGDTIVLSIIDDGRGIDPKKVAKAAINKGFLDPAKEGKLTDQQKVQLILASGFSTRDEVSELSGRGVGMDVAKTNIETFGGKLLVKSILGSGTTFEMSIPVSR